MEERKKGRRGDESRWKRGHKGEEDSKGKTRQKIKKRGDRRGEKSLHSPS